MQERNFVNDDLLQLLDDGGERIRDDEHHDEQADCVTKGAINI